MRAKVMRQSSHHQVGIFVFSVLFFWSVADLSACLISSLGSRLTPKVSMSSHKDTLHQTMDNPKSQISNKTLVK